MNVVFRKSMNYDFQLDSVLEVGHSQIWNVSKLDFLCIFVVPLNEN